MPIRPISRSVDTCVDNRNVVDPEIDQLVCIDVPLNLVSKDLGPIDVIIVIIIIIILKNIRIFRPM